MGKVIIDNRTESLPDSEALWFVSKVMERGRISDDGKQYCYVTTYSYFDNQIVIHASLNKQSDRFVLQEETS